MPGSKRICRQCLNDDRYLNNIIASDPDASESCDYCDSEEMTMSMETLAEKVDWLIENYYRGGEYNHYLEEYEGEPLFSVLEQEVTANDNIIDELVALAIKNNYEHCFVVVSGEKKNISPSTTQSLESLSILNEVQTGENDSLTAQPNKRETALESPPKKKGRPAKSKE